MAPGQTGGRSHRWDMPGMGKVRAQEEKQGRMPAVRGAGTRYGCKPLPGSAFVCLVKGNLRTSQYPQGPVPVFWLTWVRATEL